MRKLAVVAALILLLAVPRLSEAQQKTTTCAQTLRLARSIYENGRLHELPDLMKDCIGKTEWSTQERVDAYKLLTLSYIYLEEPEKADEMMLNILRTDPEFKPNDNIDPAEFVALWRTFRTEPVYRLGVKAGGNATQPNVHSYSPLNEGTENYDYGVGFQAGLSSEIAIFNEKLYLNPELYYNVKSFKVNNSFFEGDQTTTGTIKMSWISLPVSVQYPLSVGRNKIDPKWVPYVSGGISLDYLLGVKTDLTTNINDQSDVKTSTAGKEAKAQYASFNFAPIISAGVKGKVKKAEIVAEIRYNFGVATIFDKQKLYESQSEVFGNKFVHGPFSLNTLSVSFGYLMNKYSPRKKTTH
ncbi:MAG TPA: porin family protein [Cyclobacteriaceae bacterium]|nr:porin family protein [Cyclobacteriaceae bacterium]